MWESSTSQERKENVQETFNFKGNTFNHGKDYERLSNQLQRVSECVLSQNKWLTLFEIHALTKDPEASISARLRDLRKLGFNVQSRRRDGYGTWEYRVTGSKKL